jgi:hypothetical protein
MAFQFTPSHGSRHAKKVTLFCIENIDLTLKIPYRFQEVQDVLVLAILRVRIGPESEQESDSASIVYCKRSRSNLLKQND